MHEKKIRKKKVYKRKALINYWFTFCSQLLTAFAIVVCKETFLGQLCYCWVDDAKLECRERSERKKKRMRVLLGDSVFFFVRLNYAFFSTNVLNYMILSCILKYTFSVSIIMKLLLSPILYFLLLKEVYYNSFFFYVP